MAVLDDTDWAVTLVVHHAVFDGASLPVLAAELNELCLAAAEHREPKLPELAIQYADYAAWQRSQAATEHLAYWRETLAGLPALHGVPTDRPRPPELTYAGDQVAVDLPDGLLGRTTAYRAAGWRRPRSWCCWRRRRRCWPAAAARTTWS